MTNDSSQPQENPPRALQSLPEGKEKDIAQTKKEPVKSDIKIVTNVIKEPEFQAFLAMVESDALPDTWEMVATAIGVHQNTITIWRKTPEFQKALAKGIHNAMQSMEKAGRHDWRMWREKIALLTKEKQSQSIGVQNNYVQTNTIVFTNFRDETKG